MSRGRLYRAAALLLAAALATSLAGCIAPDNTVSLPAADLAGPRLLVIAPHPDDETVGVGGAIAEARQRGWDVSVVFVTSGDGFWQALRGASGSKPSAAQMRGYGEGRMAEALRATAALGVPRSNVYFLGFPDGSTHFLWGANWNGPPVQGTNGERKVPYAFAFSPGAPYTGSSLENQLERIVRQVRPTTVLLPDAADVHRDHWATNAFVQTALVRTGYSGLALTYVVHRAGFPTQRGSQPGRVMGPPTALLANGTRWLSLPLSAGAQQAQVAALEVYQTQLKADGPLVRAFVQRPNEVLGLAPSAFVGTGTVTLPEGTHDPIYRGGQPSANVRAIRLARGDASATVSLVLQAPVKPGIAYVVHARAFGADGTLRFYDASVKDGRLTPLRTSASSVAAPGALLSAKGPLVVVKLPAQLLDGARWLFVGADTYAGPLTADHAAWSMVRVLPR